MTSTRLTSDEYWERGYAALGKSIPLPVEDYRYLGERRIAERIESIGLGGKRILEVGAGNSALLAYLARKYAGGAEFTGLDYTESGCRMLASRAQREGVSIRVVQQDFFEPDPSLIGQYDVVYSIGVVEHFGNLASALGAKRNLLATGGRMFTLIPNMAGAIGALTRRYNTGVFGLHNPHDMDSFIAGHVSAGLAVESFGYLCSTNFGVLSACFKESADRGWNTYKWLSRLTKALWFVEARIGDLPHTALLSPYLVSISRAGP